MHRNLHVVGHRKDVDDTSCRACDEKESMLHLVQCHVIRDEFWKQVLHLVDMLGFTGPAEGEVDMFLALGCYTDKGQVRTVAPELAGLMFIAWRCLYAAILGSRVDNRPLNLDYAYKRTLQLCITRLKA